MTDIAIQLEQGGLTTPRFDIGLGQYDLTSEQGLRTAVMISLFTDHRADPDDEIPDGTDDRRGYWADTYPDIDADLLGSRLWLLGRAKQTADVLNRAREYSLEALQWMLDDGVAKSINVEAEWVRQGVLGLAVAITLNDGSQFEDLINYELNRA